jgi:hypothetical protein
MYASWAVHDTGWQNQSRAVTVRPDARSRSHAPWNPGYGSARLARIMTNPAAAPIETSTTAPALHRGRTGIHPEPVTAMALMPRYRPIRTDD